MIDDKASWIMYASLDSLARKDVASIPEIRGEVYRSYFFTIGTDEPIDSPTFFSRGDGPFQDCFGNGFTDTMNLRTEDFFRLYDELQKDLNQISGENSTLRELGIKPEQVSAKDKLMETYKDSFLNIKEFPKVIREGIAQSINKERYLQGALEAIFQVDNILTETVKPEVQDFLQEALLLRGVQVISLPIYAMNSPERFLELNKMTSGKRLVEWYRQSELHGFLDQMLEGEESISRLVTRKRSSMKESISSRVNITPYYKGRNMAERFLNRFRWDYIKNNKRFYHE